MKKLTNHMLVLFFCCFSINGAAQNLPFNNYPQHKEDWLKEHVRSNPVPAFKQSTDPIMIPIQVHIVANDDGSQFFSGKRLLERLCELNEHFEETGFYFYMQHKPNSIYNTALNNHTDILDILPEIGEVYIENAINIFYVNNPISTCGYTYFPEENDFPFIMLNRSDNCNGLNSVRLTRFLGHFFALPPTYHGWLPNETPDTPEYVTRDPNLRNCHETGDYFCDTDADYVYFPWQPPFDPMNFPGATVADPLGDTISPDASLFMNAIDPENFAVLPYRFSEEQMAAMQAYLFDQQSHLLNSSPVIQDVTGTPAQTFPQDGASQAANFVNLKWQQVEKADVYIVEISTNGVFTNIVHQAFVSDTALIINLQEHANFYWRVNAFSKTGFCAPASDTQTFSTIDSLPFEVSIETHFCADAVTGDIDVEVTGANQDFEIDIQGGQFTGLTPGKYALTVTNDNHDTLQTEVDLYPYPEMEIHFTHETSQLSAQVSGGNPPFNYVWSDGSQTQIIENPEPGSYAVTITDASGCEATKSLEISSAPQVMQLFEEIKTFPNPLKTNGLLHLLIETTEDQLVQYELINLQGQSVMSGKLNLQAGSNSANIRIGQIPSGVYFLSFSSGRYSQHVKMVVME